MGKDGLLLYEVTLIGCHETLIRISCYIDEMCLQGNVSNCLGSFPFVYHINSGYLVFYCHHFTKITQIFVILQQAPCST